MRGHPLADERVGAVGPGDGHLVERTVRHEAIDAAPFVFELRHRLLERRSFDADQVGDRHPHVGEEHLAEVAVGGHVGDRPNVDARRVHRHDDLADPTVRRAVTARSADEVAVVGLRAEARPDLLPVDHELVALAAGARDERREVGAGVRFGHPDAPGGLAREDAGQELGLLVGRAVLDQRRPHLTIGEPDRGDRCPGRDQLLADDQPVDGRLAAAARLHRPRHPDPAVRRHLDGELLGEAVDPRIVVPAVPLDRLGGDLPGLLTEGLLLGRPGEVHHGRA